MSRVLLIDLSAVFWPRYRATAGEDVATASRGALAQIHDLAGRYDHCAIAADSPNSFRRELSPVYKANREKDPVASELLFKLQETLRGDGFVVWQSEGFEADDVLATAARKVVEAGHEAVIASSDKDLCACVGPGVTLYHTMKMETWDAAKVQERFGVTPAQVPDYLALVGDAADAVPGVRGCGAKHAARLLQEFGTLDWMVAAIQSASSKDRESVTPQVVRFNLIEAHESGTLALSRKLIALRYDVPVSILDAFVPRVPKPKTEEPDYMADEPNEEAPPPPEPNAPEPATPTPAPAKEPEQKSTALAVIEAELIAPSDPRFSVQLEPRGFTDGWRFAKAAFMSRVYSNIPTAEAAWLVILQGRSLGLSAVSALQGAHIIEGRICWHAAVIIGRVLASEQCEFFECIETTDKIAVWEGKRRGRPSQKLVWTFEDATKAGLTGATRSGKPSNWHKYPRTMLRWRCGVELARMMFPEVTANVYTPDEVSEDAEIREPVFLEPPRAVGEVKAIGGDDFLGDALDDPKPLDGDAIRRIERYAETLDLSRVDLLAILKATCDTDELAKCRGDKEGEIIKAIKAKGEEK